MAIVVNQPTNSDLYLLMQTVLQRAEGVSTQFAGQLEEVRNEIRETRTTVDSTIGEVMLLRDRVTSLENSSSNGSWSGTGSAKGARSSPSESSPGTSGSRTASSDDAAPGTYDKCKVHVTTHQSALVSKDAVAIVVKARAAHANLGSDDFVLLGGSIGSRFTLRFSRAEHASQFLAALRGADGWIKDTVRNPNADASSQILLYYSADKSARQRRIDYAWRRLKDAIKEQVPSQDMQDGIRVEPRDHLVASGWDEVCRLRVGDKDLITIGWKADQRVFSAAQIKTINDAVVDALNREWG